MLYSDEEQKRAAWRARYWQQKRRKAQAKGSLLWHPVDMLLAVWCVEFRRQLGKLDLLWRVVVPMHSYSIRTGEGFDCLGTRIMASVDGTDFRVCEYEEIEIADRLLDEKELFRDGLTFHALRVRRMTNADR